jgi:transcriptional regulator with XRE-family HTH domain
MTLTAMGGRIRDLLDYRQLPQAWLARELGVSPSTVARWVNGNRQMSVATLAQVADKLHTTPNFLLYGSNGRR